MSKPIIIAFAGLAAVATAVWVIVDSTRAYAHPPLAQKKPPVEVINAAEPQPSGTVYEVGKTYDVAIADLKPNPQQPRKHFTAESLASLAESIKRDGLLQPIAFTEVNGVLTVVAGGRRLQATAQAGLMTISACFVRGDLLEYALKENMLREDLTTIEQAEAVKIFYERKGLSQGDFAAIINLERSTVNEILRIADLPQHIRDSGRSVPQLSRRALLKIAKLEDFEEQQKKFDELFAKVTEGLGVQSTDTAQEQGAQEKSEGCGASPDASSEHNRRFRSTKVEAFIAKTVALTDALGSMNQRLPHYAPEQAEDIVKNLDNLITKATEVKKQLEQASQEGKGV